MLGERVGKPIQHENCAGRVRKSWKKSLIGIKLSSFIQHKISSSNAILNIFASFAIGESDPTFHPTWEKCYVG